MLDVKMIRLNEDEVKERLATRNVKSEIIDELLAQDKLRRELVVQTETLKQKEMKYLKKLRMPKETKKMQQRLLMI